MRCLLALLFFSVLACAAPPTTEIKVDQVGYLPAAMKQGIVVSKTAAGSFEVRRTADQSLAFAGRLSPATDDPDSGDSVRTADFTALKAPGAYYLQVEGSGRSWDFSIAPDVFARAYYLAMRSYYGQRCGTAVDLGPEFPGYSHAACHLVGAYHPTSGKTGSHRSAMGWHDAGDYGRYVVNSGISTGTLLWTYELFPERVRAVKLNLPESGNGTPDILNEVHWNLEWLLSMQDADGGVWQKQTSERFCAFVVPEADKLVSYVIGTGSAPFKSSCATADLAAVMAIAARVYRPFDATFASQCLLASKHAWDWLQKNPAVLYHNPPGIFTGDYGDRDCSDERLWAAAELWRTAGDEIYHRYFLSNQSAQASAIRANGPPGWNNLGAMALWTYALSGRQDADAAVLGRIRSDSATAANTIVERSQRNGYRNSLTTRDYGWGSNGTAANYGMQLVISDIIAGRSQPNPLYREVALDNLHYLLGRNTFSLSWVTQVGENPFKHPHHRPSAADNNPEPWPGLLSGGPNRGKQDPAMKNMPDLPPARMYLDDQASYASNEVAINWNAALVFLLAANLQAR